MSRIIGVNPVAAMANEYRVPGAFIQVQVNKDHKEDGVKPDFLMFMSIDDILGMTDFGKEFKITSGHSFIPKYYTYINAKRCAEEGAISFETVISRLLRWALVSGIISLEQYSKYILTHYAEYYQVCYRTSSRRLIDFVHNYFERFVSMKNVDSDVADCAKKTGLDKLIGVSCNIDFFMKTARNTMRACGIPAYVNGKLACYSQDIKSDENFDGENAILFPDYAVLSFISTYFMNDIPTSPKYEKVVYVSHGYGGKPENKERIDKAFHLLVKEMPQILFLSPVHAFGEVYADTDYVQGLNMCLSLLDRCDEMWVLDENWRESRGCTVEVRYCTAHGIPCYLPDGAYLAEILKKLNEEMKE